MGDGTGGALRYLARARLRTGWRGLAAVLLLSALTVAGAVTVLGGARRTSTALERAVDRARVADVAIDVSSDRLDDVRRLDGVTDASLYAFVAVRPAGTDLVGGIDVVGVQPQRDDTLEAMDRLRLEGRLPDPGRLDEVAINPFLAERMDLRVGDQMAIEAYTQHEVFEIFGAPVPPEPSGAAFDATVVGIGSPIEELAGAVEGDFGLVVLSPAARRLGPPLDLTAQEIPDAQIGLFRLVLRARLDAGAAGVDRFTAEVFDLYGEAEASTAFAESREDVVGYAADATRVDATALALLGGAMVAAGLVATAQAASREAGTFAGSTGEVLRSVGFSRASRWAAATIPVAAAVGLGAVLGLAAAIAASAAFPRGLARRLEPDPGPWIDAAVLAAAAGLSVVLVVLSAAVSMRAIGRDGSARSPRTFRIPLTRRLGMSIGVRMAVDRRAGSASVPVPAALSAAVLGVAGLVAAMTFGGSLGRLVDDPALSGSPWTARVVLQTGLTEDAAARIADLRVDDGIRDVVQYELVEVELETAGLVTAAELTPLRSRRLAPGALTTLEGRLPRRVGEVAVDPSAIDGPGPPLGRALTALTAEGEQRLVVVGHLTRGALAPLVTTGGQPPARHEEAFEDVGLLVWSRSPGAATSVRATLSDHFAEVEPPAHPDHVENLRGARGYPRAFAAFVALLGASAVGHLLVTSARRRSLDLAVLRALGSSRRHATSSIAWQAVTVVSIALLIGVPLGLAAGSAAWRALASSLVVVPRVMWPLLGVAAVIPGALVVGLAAAAGPVLWAGRARIASVLRTE